MLFFCFIINVIKHIMTGKINDAIESEKYRGEIQIVMDSNLYFLVCTMSRITSQNDQIAEKKGIYLLITAWNCWKCSLDL